MLIYRAVCLTCIYSTSERTKFGERVFSHAAPAAWNSLPDELRQAPTFNSSFSTAFSYRNCCILSNWQWTVVKHRCSNFYFVTGALQITNDDDDDDDDFCNVFLRNPAVEPDQFRRNLKTHLFAPLLAFRCSAWPRHGVCCSGNWRGQKPYKKGPACSKCENGASWCTNGLCNGTSYNRSLIRPIQVKWEILVPTF